MIDAARNNNFRSISIKLTFMAYLTKVIAMQPNRLSVFNYVHIPEGFKMQRHIDAKYIPSAEIKMEILQQSIRQLTDAGYVDIGMEHFAKPDDELLLLTRIKTNYIVIFKATQSMLRSDWLGHYLYWLYWRSLFLK